MSNYDLKPCPFCGQTKSLEIEEIPNIFINSDKSSYRVICDISKDGCGCKSGYEYSEEDIVKAWNRRA